MIETKIIKNIEYSHSFDDVEKWSMGIIVIKAK